MRTQIEQKAARWLVIEIGIPELQGQNWADGTYKFQKDPHGHRARIFFCC